MGLWNSLAGNVTAELTSADAIGFLQQLQQKEITVWDVEEDSPLQYRFRLSRRDAKLAKLLAQKRGDQLRILRMPGLFWLLKGLLRRPVLVVGMTALLLFSLWVPGRIFFVRVEGNSTVPENRIIALAESCGIGFGASRREVRSEKMKNALLAISPELQWAGVNTYGCVAVITVRERNGVEPKGEEKTVSSIVAAQDGIIREITVRKGSALCKVGQAVKAGQVLVSGYTDCGIYIQADHADGEVFGQTQRNLTALFPAAYVQRGKIIEETKNFSLVIGKKRINFAKGSGISGAGCAKIETEYKLTLPGGFILPVKLVQQHILSYETAPLQPDQAEPLLQAFAQAYVQSRMIAGKIETRTEVITQAPGLYRLDGIYGCYELIGIQRIEENLSNYGKSD